MSNFQSPNLHEHFCWVRVPVPLECLWKFIICLKVHIFSNFWGKKNVCGGLQFWTLQPPAIRYRITNQHTFTYIFVHACSQACTNVSTWKLTNYIAWLFTSFCRKAVLKYSFLPFVFFPYSFLSTPSLPIFKNVSTCIFCLFVSQCIPFLIVSCLLKISHTKLPPVSFVQTADVCSETDGTISHCDDFIVQCCPVKAKDSKPSFVISKISLL